MRKYFLIIFLFLFAWSVQTQAQEPHHLKTFGLIEKVALFPGGLVVQGKLDTGADNCSLDAKNIQEFVRDGKTWVRFEIKNRRSERQMIEVETHRVARIKRTLGKSQERYVVRLGICLGNEFSMVDVNLIDRSNFSVPLLVGRSFLAGRVAVDSSSTYTRPPTCKEPFDHE